MAILVDHPMPRTRGRMPEGEGEGGGEGKWCGCAIHVRSEVMHPTSQLHPLTLHPFIRSYVQWRRAYALATQVDVNFLNLHISPCGIACDARCLQVGNGRCCSPRHGMPFHIIKMRLST